MPAAADELSAVSGRVARRRRIQEGGCFLVPSETRVEFAGRERERYMAVARLSGNHTYHSKMSDPSAPGPAVSADVSAAQVIVQFQSLPPPVGSFFRSFPPIKTKPHLVNGARVGWLFALHIFLRPIFA